MLNILGAASLQIKGVRNRHFQTIHYHWHNLLEYLVCNTELSIKIFPHKIKVFFNPTTKYWETKKTANNNVYFSQIV